ncbi:MAG: NADPH dehydrogenase NamA [Bacillota bacterium]
MEKLLENYKLKNLNLRNRIVMPPMCMYMAKEGYVNSFHIQHYTTRAIGGVGFIIVEATAVSEEGRITDDDLGIWSDKHVKNLKKLVENVKNNKAMVALQLAHAGRKSDVKDSTPISSSEIKFSDDYKKPKLMTIKEIKKIVKKFKNAARRANEAGFDAIEIHGAHGYLINQFLSPLTNKRKDIYGGGIKNRIRFLKEIITEVKKVWPKEKVIILRLSANEYHSNGNSIKDILNIVNMAKENGIDLINVSSGGVINTSVDAYPGYQIPFSEIIKKETNMSTIAGGLITDEKQGEEIIANNRGDLVYYGRKLLRSPYFPLKVSANIERKGIIPKSYEKAF